MLSWLPIAGVREPGTRWVVRWGLALGLAAIFARLVFWGYTGRVWEDALITLAHAENAAGGLGLTLNQGGGRPVQGFSSPLGVLIPLAGNLLMAGSGLTVLRLASALAGGLTVIYVLVLAIHPKVRPSGAGAVLAMGYAAFEHHQISWGMSGMETQLATLALVASLYYLLAGRAYALGVSLGFCVLARPEFSLWAVAAGMVVLARSRRDFAVVTCAGLGLYVPWLVFSTFYYGSPVPNTIIAKGLGYPLWWGDGALTMGAAARHLGARLSCAYLPDSIFQPLGPSFAGHGTHFSRVIGDHGAVCALVLLFVVAGCGMALYRRRWEMVGLVLFAGVFSVYLLFGVAHVFAWYVTPFALVLMILAGYGIESVAGLVGNRRARAALMNGAVAAYLALMTGMLPLTFGTEKRIQEDVENVARKPACEYLAREMKAGDTVGSESLGHLAYYTGRQVYDWPGLGSRRVVEYSRAHPDGRSLGGMIKALRPDWLLLRPFEVERVRGGGDWFARDYEEVRRFAALPCAGEMMLASRSIDFEFVILRRGLNTGGLDVLKR